MVLFHVFGKVRTYINYEEIGAVSQSLVILIAVVVTRLPVLYLERDSIDSTKLQSPVEYITERSTYRKRCVSTEARKDIR